MQRDIRFAPRAIRLGAASRMDDSEYDIPLSVVSSTSSVAQNSVPAENGALFSVLLFASLKDAAGCERIAVRVTPIVVPAEPFSTQSHCQTVDVRVSDLLRCCGEQHPALARWLPYVKIAVNCEYAQSDAAVVATDEIALLPPVSGGA